MPKGYHPTIGAAATYHANGDEGLEAAHVSFVYADGTSVDLTIDSDSRTESNVPLKQGNFNPLRYYLPA